jgi:hypothetical protein
MEDPNKKSLCFVVAAMWRSQKISARISAKSQNTDLRWSSTTSQPGSAMGSLGRNSLHTNVDALIKSKILLMMLHNFLVRRNIKSSPVRPHIVEKILTKFGWILTSEL